jgi:hypothetical protein
MSKAVPGKVFRHYKDPNKTYEIIKVVEGQPGLLNTVTYKQLYTSEDYPQGTLWVRLKGEFEGVVIKDGIVLERFSPV